MPKWKDLGLSYLEAAYGMQSGVQYELALGSDQASPKHLRVGVNSAMADQGGLAYLLIAKGLITEEEYREAIRRSMNNELALYQDRHPGVKFR